MLEEKEERQIGRVKNLLERYYRTRDEEAKTEFEEANRLYPLVFARAFQELQGEPDAGSGGDRGASGRGAEQRQHRQPRRRVDEGRRLPARRRSSASWCSRSSAWRGAAARPRRLKARGAADDILQATCAKLLARAKDSLTRSDSSSEFAARYLDMTRNSLVTAYRQVRARLTRVGG